MFKKTMIFLLAAFALLQFYPRPKKNKSDGNDNTGIEKTYAIPDDVARVLKSSCYDCHSNNTNYPWYASIQPVSLWLDDHIREGKGELNFSEFGSYEPRRQYRKLEEINEEVKAGEMPLKSYTFIHGGAKLNKDEKLAIARWVATTRDQILKTYGSEALKKKNR